MTVRRREFLSGLFGASLTSKLACSSVAQETAIRRVDGELLGPNVPFGHRLRDPIDLSGYADVPIERVEVAVVGGGPAGLSAAWRLRRAGRAGVRVFELEDVVGGTSRGDAEGNLRYPWGAHYLPIPSRDNVALRTLLEEMGALEPSIEDGNKLVPAEHMLVREPDERVFFRGYWYAGLYPFAGASADDLAELERFDQLMHRFGTAPTQDGRRPFSLPMSESSRDERLVALDGKTATEFLAEHGFSSERLLWLCDYSMRDDYGMTLEEVSAWAFVFYFCARMDTEGETAEFLTWPEGNAALTNHMARVLRGRIDTRVMAVSVREMRDEDGQAVELLLTTPQGTRRRVRAEHAVIAVPQFIADRICPDLRRPNLDFCPPSYGPWMVANVHLRGRPASFGAPPAWDNVIYDSPSVGYVSSTHQRGRDVGKGVFTYYFPMTGASASENRQLLYDGSLVDWQDAVLLDLESAHVGFRAQVEKVDVWRWGHAMIQPLPGFLGGGRRFSLQTNSGRVHFAHSDLSGLALFEEAFARGVDAADQILERFS